MMNLKFRILYTVKQHIHTSKVIGCNVFFLPIDLTNTICAKLFSYID